MMTDWLEKMIGETASIVLVLLLLIVALLCETLEWVWWVKLHRSSSPSPMRKYVEKTSLAAGTASMFLFAFLVVGFGPVFGKQPEWVANSWIFVGMTVAGIGLIASPFCRSRLRLTGTVVGVLMSAFWFEVWTLIQFARAYVGIIGGG